jgi:hypothetical protein
MLFETCKISWFSSGALVQCEETSTCKTSTTEQPATFAHIVISEFMDNVRNGLHTIC